VPAAFHPRFGARAKTYRYRIWNGDVIGPFDYRYAWHLAGPLDVDAMRAAARVIEGRHDFAAFQAAGSEVRDTTREIFVSRIADCGLRIDGGLRSDCGLPLGAGLPAQSAIHNPQSAMIVYEVVGTGFLRYMVRSIVGTLVEIGRGKQPVQWMTTVLASRDRTAAGPTAPAAGLFLVSVAYEER
jgi:tRNA pseudouridine38-40 synthase